MENGHSVHGKEVKDILETKDTFQDLDNSTENNIVGKTEIITNGNKENNENLDSAMEEEETNSSKIVSEKSEICTEKNTNEQNKTTKADNQDENTNESEQNGNSKASKENRMIPKQDTLMNDVNTESDKNIMGEETSTTSTPRAVLVGDSTNNTFDSTLSEKNEQGSSKASNNKKTVEKLESSTERSSTHTKLNKKKSSCPVEKKQVEPRFGLTAEMIEEEEKLRVEQEKQLNEIKEKVCLLHKRLKSLIDLIFKFKFTESML